MIAYRWMFLPVLASAQAVISVHSGVVHFSEGSVLVNNQPVETRPGKFINLPEGSELRTEEGRAEVLLTPGVILRVGENSGIRMISNSLFDTRVQFLSGSVALDSNDPHPETSVVMIYGDYRIRFWQRGRYRFNTEPAELRVSKGEAQVFLDDKSATVSEGQVLPFSVMLVTRQFDAGFPDDLDRWAEMRSESVSAANLQAANPTDFSSVADNAQDDPNPFVPGLGSIGGYGSPGGYSTYDGYYPTGFTSLGLWPLRAGMPLVIYVVPRPYPGLPTHPGWPGTRVGIHPSSPTYGRVGAGSTTYHAPARPPAVAPVRVARPAPRIH